MKSSTKYALAAISVASAITIVKSTKKSVSKTAESINRLRFKLLIREKLNNNPQLLEIADELDDEELKVLVDVFERLDNETLTSHASFLQNRWTLSSPKKK